MAKDSELLPFEFETDSKIGNSPGDMVADFKGTGKKRPSLVLWAVDLRIETERVAIEIGDPCFLGLVVAEHAEDAGSR